MIVIGDEHHITTMNKNINWMKPTHLLLVFPPKSYLYIELLYIYLYLKKENITLKHTH